MVRNKLLRQAFDSSPIGKALKFGELFLFSLIISDLVGLSNLPGRPHIEIIAVKGGGALVFALMYVNSQSMLSIISMYQKPTLNQLVLFKKKKEEKLKKDTYNSQMCRNDLSIKPILEAKVTEGQKQIEEIEFLISKMETQHV
ncbi:MAG: hypothetical protein KBC67_01485 [Candidatus Pacebacteria bacterium]|nr:hypothetical protein [Candidatus Paceibacterota bacterium]